MKRSLSLSILIPVLLSMIFISFEKLHGKTLTARSEYKAATAKDDLEGCNVGGLPSFAGLVKKLKPSVVNISTTSAISNTTGNGFTFRSPYWENDPFKYFSKRFSGDIPQQEFKQQELGSGFKMSEDGYVVTNNRLIDRARDFEVYYGGKEYLKVKVDTLNEAGKIGLWTKADAQTYFDHLTVVSPAVAKEDRPTEQKGVEKILNAAGQIKEGALVVRFPRSDLKMMVDGELMPTALGFTSWVAFKKMNSKDILMGDLVLLETEINPVISELADTDIKVTALHRHFLGEQPRVMYMHIHGIGEATELARGIRAALDRTATPKPSSAEVMSKVVLNTKKLEGIIGHKGKVGGGVFKITIGREGVKLGGIDLTSSMGINSWVAFVGTEKQAHVAGDIVMTPNEVNHVIRTLREGGIDIVGVHNHMLNEVPRVFYLHYWGTGPAEKLAQTVRRAFDEVKEPVT